MTENDILVQIQRTVGYPITLRIARALSHFGEHALGWMGIGALAALWDKHRRPQWLRLIAASFISHALSVIIKRIVRRQRPHDPRITIGVKTPSSLSFPSSHATSTTAFFTSLSAIVKSRVPLIGVPVMMFSRMLLGVHYPSDVLTGALVGWATSRALGHSRKA
ncbi:phosphatase PAP2 family protein [Corynebacterium sp. ES2794-CONJ1]|uniref:phosphatase PAP2 family protein n=1 Tax=unclassified Corynebacterium TaxID=2624378 RepID=UPI002166ED6C|nr:MULTISPECIES: phosphatase PAP2 family protein [unclassified Corynebacterium]MCS4492061.1 phosphatase PAP2 family protein [Corynebacterium sp. ES2715-CONJ3]MCS4532169.1 phosphatase PAP2 family protein [Corynebacterium sp. ES2730-CONJ]MCU9519565.1 phosphatase PAP2 family protein [Corynebacterium sp. ES2794-CONJ1]